MHYIIMGFSVLTVLLWILFLVYMLRNKKVIDINKFGLMLAVSVLYPYIIAYDIYFNLELNPDLKYEIIICRALVLATLYSVVKRAVEVNKKLTLMSKKEKNLLKPKKNDTESHPFKEV